jgi:hypothetical protein
MAYAQRDRKFDNEQARKNGFCEIHCPFECERADVEAKNGYCCHLVGFTNNGKLFERVEPMLVLERDENGSIRRDSKKQAMFRETGELRVAGKKRQLVLKTDILVNPTSIQKDDKGAHVKREWVSTRVYRQCSEAEATAWREKFAHAEDFDEDIPIEEDTDALIERLQRELAVAKGEASPSLAPAPPTQAEIEAANDGLPDEDLGQKRKKQTAAT